MATKNPNYVPIRRGGLSTPPIGASTSRLPSDSLSFADSLSKFGLALSIGGSVGSLVGAYFDAESKKNQLKSDALSAEHAATMANINARAAELDAQSILKAGESEIGQLTMGYGQQKSAVSAAAVAHGAEGASTQEVAASIELAKRIDVMTIDRNRVRAAGAARVRGADLGNSALLSGVSAANIRGSARSINPFAAGGTSLLASAGPLAREWSAYIRGT